MQAALPCLWVHSHVAFSDICVLGGGGSSRGPAAPREEALSALRVHAHLCTACRLHQDLVLAFHAWASTQPGSPSLSLSLFFPVSLLCTWHWPLDTLLQLSPIYTWTNSVLTFSQVHNISVALLRWVDLPHIPSIALETSPGAGRVKEIARYHVLFIILLEIPQHLPFKSCWERGFGMPDPLGLFFCLRSRKRTWAGHTSVCHQWCFPLAFDVWCSHWGESWPMRRKRKLGVAGMVSRKVAGRELTQLRRAFSIGQMWCPVPQQSS